MKGLKGGESQLERRLKVLLGVAGVCMFFRNVYVWHTTVWDDAFITFRFANHLADGAGLVWNLNGARVEGYTSFLHVALLGVLKRLGADPPTAGLVIGTSAALLTGILMLTALRFLLGSLSLVAFAMVSMYLIDENTAQHAASGLETHLFVVMLASMYLLAIVFAEKGGLWRSLLLAAAACGAILTRPEGAIYIAATYAILWAQTIFAPRHDRLRWRDLALSSGILGACCGLYAVAKYRYFGYLLPNPFYVKSARFGWYGVHDVAAFLRHAAFWLGPVLAISFLGILPRKKLPRAESPGGDLTAWTQGALTVLPPVVALAYYSTIIHEVGGAYRFSFPTFFYGVIAVAVVGSHAIALARVRLWLISAVSVYVLSVIALARPWITVVQPRTGFQRFHYLVATALQETQLRNRATILCDAAGVIPYVSEFNQLDRVGLVDNTLSGRQPLTLQQRERYIWGQRPDVYLGMEPPAILDTISAEDDPRMRTRYVARALLQHRLEKIETRIFLLDPELLHERMSELAKRWIWVGEIEWPGYQLWGVRSFVYVRRDSAVRQPLLSALRKIVIRTPDQIDLDQP
jgi:arabinofuranosyltransferase